MGTYGGKAFVYLHLLFFVFVTYTFSCLTFLLGSPDQSVLVFNFQMLLLAWVGADRNEWDPLRPFETVLSGSFSGLFWWSGQLIEILDLVENIRYAKNHANRISFDVLLKHIWLWRIYFYPMSYLALALENILNQFFSREMCFEKYIQWYSINMKFEHVYCSWRGLRL